MYDLETVKRWALDEIAKEGEGFIYEEAKRDGNRRPDCYYVDPDTLYPSCLIGRMFLTNELVTAEKLTGRETEDGCPLNEAGVSSVVDTLELQFTSEAEAFLSVLQSRQDKGEAWGYAYKMAVMAAASD